ncbi:MAG: MBL fold metallo-hydrolase [Acidobacteriaceae bacterium]|nr:MBL fold metallo-hydrolase [Acidobacteriaceae bacterium]
MSDFARSVEVADVDGMHLWWLGHAGFVVKCFDMVFIVDPCLTTPPGRKRSTAAPVRPEELSEVDLLLCTHKGASHLDPATIKPMLMACPRLKVVLPKSAASHAKESGIGYHRMTTTDSGLRVEYFKGGLYGRVYSVPSAHPELDWTSTGGYPHLGYLMRFGETTIYHAGDCKNYEGLAERLRPFNVKVALMPINGGGNFGAAEAAQLAEDIGAKWLVPMHYGTFDEQPTDINRFIDHMLGFRPDTGFKVFEPGERWTVPGD